MSNKIGWQKYEDMIQNQLLSPFASLMISNQMMFQNGLEEEEEESFDVSEILDNEDKEVIVVPVPQDFHNQIDLITNYDCWVGHTNFDITEEIKDIINRTKGVEILKVHSRYRFFIGVAKMFDFKDVRHSIESTLL